MSRRQTQLEWLLDRTNRLPGDNGKYRRQYTRQDQDDSVRRMAEEQIAYSAARRAELELELEGDRALGLTE